MVVTRRSARSSSSSSSKWYPMHRLGFGIISFFFILRSLRLTRQLILESQPQSGTDEPFFRHYPELPITVQNRSSSSSVRSALHRFAVHHGNSNGNDNAASMKAVAISTHSSNASGTFAVSDSTSHRQPIVAVERNDTANPIVIASNQTATPPLLEPVWTCSADDNNINNNKKLIFIHVFKTAGSSFRHFFKAYGRHCQKSLAIVVGAVGGECVKTPANVMNDPSKTWSDGKGSPCLVKHAIDRSGMSITLESPQQHFRGQFLKDFQPDILIGHFSFGIHQLYGDMSEKRQQQLSQQQLSNSVLDTRDDDDDDDDDNDAQYIAFFRHPVPKFVSARLYMRKFTDLDEAVSHIKEYVISQRARDAYYEKYSGYLTTPEQRANLPLQSKRRLTELVKNNLRHQNFLVGIVERMAASNELLAYAVDGNNEFPEGFETLNSPESGSNKSQLSSGDIVRELEHDVDFMAQMNKFLKYEFEIYNFALERHEAQYQWLLNERQRMNGGVGVDIANE